jgi:hypothetical protein
MIRGVRMRGLENCMDSGQRIGTGSSAVAPRSSTRDGLPAHRDIGGTGPADNRAAAADVLLHGESGLLDFADAVLPTLRLPNGLFCFDRPWGGPLRGESVRYSTMVLLGVLRRARTGAAVSVDPGKLHGLLHDRRRHLGVGELGLLLWADVRIGDTSAARATLTDLERASTSASGIASLEGMEAAWFALGAIAAYSAGIEAGPLVTRSMAELRGRESWTSPLFHHFGARTRRARFPNFATQIYSLMALTEAARHDIAPDAQDKAERLADLLIRSRDASFGWPWLYDSERGVVVERYEVYSVHQDAMAPMALLALTEVTGDRGYADAAVEGLRWGFGNNELGADFYDHARPFAHRSIRRAGIARHIGLYGNTALAVMGRSTRLDPRRLELNATCRPYHLGWILEAWSDRDWIDTREGRP